MTAETLFLPRKTFPPLTPLAAHAARKFSATRSLPQIGAVALRIAPPPDTVIDAETVWFRVGDESGCALVPRPVLTDVLAALDPASVHAPAQWRALLLEIALADTLDRLRTACPALAVEIASEPPTDGDAERIAFGIHIGEAALRLELGPRAARHAIDLLAAIPPQRRDLPDVPIDMHVRRCTADITLDELRSLREGDVVLVDTLGDDDILLVAGEHLAWRARRTGTRITVSTPRTTAKRTWEGWTMQDDPALAGPDASLDELPIRLAFELGKLAIPLAELQAIGPGYVFELARADGEAVDIVANGRRIGRGRIVDVAGALGVQVVRIGP